MPRKRPQSLELNLNLTPMIDVTFQLIIFFVLVTNFSAAQLPPLQPPDPTHSQATSPETREDRLTVNLLPDPARPGELDVLRIGATRLEPHQLARLGDLLRSELGRHPQLQVNLRADASLRYDQIHPVLTALTQAGVPRVNVVALIESETSR